MAVQLWPNRKHTTDAPPVDDRATSADRPVSGPADGTPGGSTGGGRRFAWPHRPRTADRDRDTVVVDRKRWHRMRRHRHNPISRLVWAAGWTAAIILLAGMLLTWIDANPANGLVNGVLNIGEWLATPFHDLFRNPDADHRLYQNWGVAAAVYYILGRVLSWLIR